MVKNRRPKWPEAASAAPLPGGRAEHWSVRPSRGPSRACASRGPSASTAGRANLQLYFRTPPPCAAKDADDAADAARHSNNE